MDSQCMKMIQFEEEKNKQAEKLRVQRQKVDILRDKVIPYLRQFTEKIYSYTDELSLRKRINKILQNPDLLYEISNIEIGRKII